MFYISEKNIRETVRKWLNTGTNASCIVVSNRRKTAEIIQTRMLQDQENGMIDPDTKLTGIHSIQDGYNLWSGHKSAVR